MRITIVQGAFFPIPPLLGGAVEKKWFALGKVFAARGHSVTHISRLYGELSEHQIIDGVLHRRVPGFDVPASLILLKAADLAYSYQVLKVLPEADILITNTFWLPLLPVKRRRGLVYTHIARYPKGQHRFYARAARLQTVSTPVARAVCQQAPKLAGRVKVIPNFVWNNRQADSRGSREKCILYVGRVHPEKGLDLLVNVFARLATAGMSAWKLLIVGPWEIAQGGGGHAYYEKLRHRSRGYAEFVGPVFDEKRLNEYYDNASLLVYPSLAEKGEAFGLAPLEAMARGCPALVSGLDCFKDFIEDGKNGWIFNHRDRDGESSLESRMREVLANSDERETVSRNALTAAERFTIEKVASLYLEDFEGLLSSRQTSDFEIASC